MMKAMGLLVCITIFAISRLSARGENGSSDKNVITSYFSNFLIDFYYDRNTGHTSIIEYYSKTQWMMINLNRFEIDLSGTSFMFQFNDQFSIVLIPGKAGRFYSIKNRIEEEIQPDNCFEIINNQSQHGGVYLFNNTKLQEANELYIYEYIVTSEGIIEDDVFALYTFKKSGWLYKNAKKFLNIISLENCKIFKIDYTPYKSKHSQNTQ